MNKKGRALLSNKKRGKEKKSSTLHLRRGEKGGANLVYGDEKGKRERSRTRKAGGKKSLSWGYQWEGMSCPWAGSITGGEGKERKEGEGRLGSKKNEEELR